MPAQVIWALSSLADLTAIVSLIAADNPAAAQRVAAQIRERTRQLESFPLSGPHYDFTPAGEVRELIIPPYRIFYRVTDDGKTVRILRIWHSARGTPDIPRV
jgi:addiction module RelE/StbE family toxin